MTLDLILSLYLLLGIATSVFLLLAHAARVKEMPTGEILFTIFFVMWAWPLVLLVDLGSRFCAWCDKKRGIGP